MTTKHLASRLHNNASALIARAVAFRLWPKLSLIKLKRERERLLRSFNALFAG